ncbi:MAG: glycosyltransferase family 9 protein [Chthoniobacterales bacterium]|nr:glycosyltransferase family 9 protein [Chthoniobacterales bacterium]
MKTLPPKLQINSILIIKPGSLGDIVHALPCLVWLRSAYAKAKIGWIVDERWAPILSNNEYLDQIIHFPRKQFFGLRGKFRFIRWLNSLKDLRPSLAIDLQGLLRSALIALATRAKHILGGDDAREGAKFFYKITANVNPNSHAVMRYRSILCPLNISLESPPQFPLPIGIPPSQKTIPPNYLLLHPYARGINKSLQPQQVAFLVKNLYPHSVVLVGIGPSPPEIPNNLHNFLNQTTLLELIWLVRNATFVISTDSGPAHIASALNVPLLAIHTWSEPQRVGPPNPNSFVWKNGEISKQREFLSSSSPIKKINKNNKLLDNDALLSIAKFVKHFLKHQQQL